jgi:hypothetical protein
MPFDPGNIAAGSFPETRTLPRRAGRILDLYQRLWQNHPLQPDEYVICADEKTSIQARCRKRPTLATAPNRPLRVEPEYWRRGALIYLVAWDVHQAKLYGCCAPMMRIRVFDELVEQVMSRPPYRTASRVFWIVDNVSSHRGEACRQRLQSRWPNLEVVHTPVHASWLNQVEIYFSVVQRKVLTPNDFSSLTALEDSLLRFQEHYQQAAKPFEWKFTRENLSQLLARLQQVSRAA